MDIKIKKENDSNRKLVIPTFKSSDEINKEIEQASSGQSKLKPIDLDVREVTPKTEHEDNLQLTTQIVTTQVDTDSLDTLEVDTIDLENDLKVIETKQVDEQPPRDEDTINFNQTQNVEHEEDVIIETPTRQININLAYVYVAISFIVIVIGGLIGYKLYQNATSDEKFIAAALEQQLPISDINVYGESVNLITDQNLEQIDIYNVETEEKTTEKLGKSIDQQLHFSKLEDGVYYLFAGDQIITSKEKLSVNYQTITRDKVNKDVSLTSNEQNIVEVTVATATKPKVDIIIDASQGDVQGFTASDNKTTEQELSLKYALTLKSNLQKYGYNVELTRTEDAVPGDCNYNQPYCDTGRVAMAYTNNPKLYISIGFNGTGANGFEITDSTLNSHTLARLIKSSITTNIEPSQRVNGQLETGIFNKTYKDKADNAVDYLYLIRETGGRIMNSDNQEAKKFNQKQVGAETIRIDPGYIGEQADFKQLDEDSEIDAFTKGLAVAIDQYINRY